MLIFCVLCRPKDENDVFGRLYFIYSFGFLILRMLAVCIYGSNIDTESKQSIFVLDQLPSASYNTEVSIRNVKYLIIRYGN